MSDEEQREAQLSRLRRVLAWRITTLRGILLYSAVTGLIWFVIWWASGHWGIGIAFGISMAVAGVAVVTSYRSRRRDAAAEPAGAASRRPNGGPTS